MARHDDYDDDPDDDRPKPRRGDDHEYGRYDEDHAPAFRHQRQGMFQRPYLRIPVEEHRVVGVLRDKVLFSSAEDSTRVPHCEWSFAAGTNCRDPIARNSRLIVNDRDLTTDEAIEERRLPDIRTPDDCDVRQFCLFVHHGAETNRAQDARVPQLATDARLASCK